MPIALRIPIRTLTFSLQSPWKLENEVREITPPPNDLILYPKVTKEKERVTTTWFSKNRILLTATSTKTTSTRSGKERTLTKDLGTNWKPKTHKYTSGSSTLNNKPNPWKGKKRKKKKEKKRSSIFLVNLFNSQWEPSRGALVYCTITHSHRVHDYVYDAHINA